MPTKRRYKQRHLREEWHLRPEMRHYLLTGEVEEPDNLDDRAEFYFERGDADKYWSVHRETLMAESEARPFGALVFDDGLRWGEARDAYMRGDNR